MKSLYDEMRRPENIYAAWQHVRKSSLNSDSKDIRREASEFESKHRANLDKIVRELRAGAFRFDPVKGILKDKRERELKGKKPRPIAIAGMRNKVVQRAILQVLQPRVKQDESRHDSKHSGTTDPRLGRINSVNSSKYGVGGLIAPHGGTKKAVEFILAAMENGATHYFRTDIRDFFTAIPADRVIDFVARETQDERLTAIFAAGLEVHLANARELGKYSSLFPKDGTGVAQGSSLSSFASNVLLHDLDQEMNSSEASTVRYIDDVLVLAKSSQALEEAVDLLQKRLQEMKLQIHPLGSDKSETGRCVDAITFLGCSIQPRRCVPSAKNMKGIKAVVQARLSESSKAISLFARAMRSFDPHQSFACTVVEVGAKLHSWRKSFDFCTDNQPFAELDRHMAKALKDYRHSVSRHLQALGSGPVTALVFHRLSCFMLPDFGGWHERAVLVDSQTGRAAQAALSQGPRQAACG